MGGQKAGMAFNFFSQGQVAFFFSAGGDGAGPSDPASSRFWRNGGEARRDPAGIRLNLEAVPDAPNGDRETGRDQDERHVRNKPIMHPAVDVIVVDGALRSDSEMWACRRAEYIARYNAVLRRPSMRRTSTTKTMDAGCFPPFETMTRAHPRKRL